ncbi:MULTISPECIES: IPTL-CTERM sorting domain-containing protein [Acidovorax]|uniref:IPTL-CTERM sorting domain-containing protein n=1 Tax=Acidovorax TaxID=12916 RepID=UPI00023766A6|nr:MULTISPECIES: IPTL-CTERM sorting domain-containing protein [Acidovorax]KRD22113.1 hypothetical protein ASE39_06980 [Acidovorax sp. Root267]
MKKTLLLLAALFVQASAWAATYTYAGPPYSATNLHNYTNCIPGFGNCGTYTTAMAQAGSFTTAAPLPGNLNFTDITAQVTSFSFSDGLTTYSSSDPQVTLVSVMATTTGGILEFGVIVQRWQASAPHAVGDHLDQMNIHLGGSHNAECQTVPVSTTQGAIMCGTTYVGDVYSSWHDTNTGGVWTLAATPPAAPTAVPTLGEWGLVLLAGLLAALGLRQRREA